MTITYANPGDELFISKPIARIKANLNGPLVIRTMPGKDGQPSVLQPMPRHQHLMVACKRFNSALLGQHHLQFPPRHASRDTVTEKLQKNFPNRWSFLANSSNSERSGVALAWCTDL